MSSVHERIHPENVNDMTIFLLDTFRALNQADEVIHSLRDQIKARLYALHAAESKTVRARMEQIERLIESEEPVETITGSELLSRYNSFKESEKL